MTPPSLQRVTVVQHVSIIASLAATLVQGCVEKSDSTEMNLRDSIGRTLGLPRHSQS